MLRECLNTVPKDVEAIRALLQYGLQETDLHVLEMMERDESEGRFIKAKVTKATDENYYLSEEEAQERQDQEQQRLISQIDWDNLTVSQRDLLAARYTLLKYLDRLECYIDIVEDGDDFDHDFYVKFRDEAILSAAVDFAHKGKSRAVATLLERYGG